MFDPVFAILFLAAVAALIAAVIYWLVRKDLPTHAAILMAVVVPIAGMIGFFTGAIAVSASLSLSFMDVSMVGRIAFPLVTGIITAALMAVVLWRTSRLS